MTAPKSETADLVCRRERAVLDELSRFDAATSELELQLVESTLERLRSQHAVVALRPGTAPPTPKSEKHRVRLNTWASLGASLAIVALVVGYVSSRPSVGRSEAAKRAAHFPAAAAPFGRVTLLSGEVRVDGRLQRLAAGTLQGGERVSVASGRACLALEHGVVTCLSAGTQVLLPKRGEKERTVVVEHGQVVAKLEKQPAGHGFSLAAGSTRARATGTAFALAAEAGQALTVDVFEGSVQVSNAESSVDLARGQRWQRTGMQSAVPVEAEAQCQALLLGSAGLGSAAFDGAVFETEPMVLQVESNPDGADIELDGKAVGRTPLGLLVNPNKGGTSHSLWLNLEGHERVQRAFDLGPGDVHRLFFELEPSAMVAAKVGPRGASGVARAPDEATVPATDARSLLTEARRLVGESRFGEAATTYRRLRATYPGSAEAKTVSVALGQLELDRLSQPRAARQSFQSYLDTGGGALSQEARYGKVRAARALGDRSAELAAIHEYLKAHSNGVNAPALERRARELAGE